MRIRGLRWWIAGLLFLSTVINYVDRQTLSVLAPVLKQDLGITDVQYASITTAFLAAYTLMYVVSGLLVDRWGVRWPLAGFVVWWSLANMAHAFARGPWSLGALRCLLGLGESGNFMAASKAVSEWYPARERAFVNGLVQAGAAIGSTIALPAITAINAAFGWQPAFLFTGALGLAWLVPWLLLYHPPGAHPWITAHERALVPGAAPSTTAAAGPQVSWRQLLARPQTWGLLVSRFFSDALWWFYTLWLSKYLVEGRGLSMETTGYVAWVPYLAADLGAVTGGLLSGRLVARGWNPIRARLAVMLPCAAAMLLNFLVDRVEWWTSLALISVVAFAHMAWKANQNTLTNDVYPRGLIGTAAGMLAFGTGLGGTLLNWPTGFVVEHFGYGPMFMVLGLLHPLAYVVTRTLVRRPLGEEAAHAD